MQTPWREMIEAGASAYRRERDLPKVLPDAPEGTAAIVAELGKRADAQGRLGRRQHWSYDLNRHVAYLTALHAEKATLAHEQNVRGLANIFHQAAE